ncbi:MAG: response regulator transcription factor [candidate division Zixibacteria bacterium]
MRDTIKVILADDHPVIVVGLEHIISLENDIEVVGKTVNGNDAVTMAETRDVDVVAMDISMPGLNGFEAANLIKRAKPDVKIVFITMYDNIDYIDRAKSIGIDGYILKEDAPDMFLKVLRNVMNGFVDFRVESPKTSVNTRSRILNLTERETEIVTLMARGKSTKAIAENLGIAVKTVNCHRSNIKLKLKAKSSADIFNLAYKYKLIDPNMNSRESVTTG